MVMAMREAGDKEGEGGKALLMATRIVGKWTVMETKRAIVTAMRVQGKQGQKQQRG